MPPDTCRLDDDDDGQAAHSPRASTSPSSLCRPPPLLRAEDALPPANNANILRRAARRPRECPRYHTHHRFSLASGDPQSLGGARGQPSLTRIRSLSSFGLTDSCLMRSPSELSTKPIRAPGSQGHPEKGPARRLELRPALRGRLLRLNRGQA